MASNELCFNCTKACGRCSWSKEHKPIQGWKAVETRIVNIYKNGTKREVKSYEIIYCPEHQLSKMTTYSDNTIQKMLGIKLSKKKFNANRELIMKLLQAHLRGLKLVPLIRSKKLIELNNKKETGKNGKFNVSNSQKTYGKAQSRISKASSKRGKSVSSRAVHSVNECIQG